MKYTKKDYQKIENVINYLNLHYTRQPSLEELASVAGLSLYHFQRKFTAWVGVSPKSFLQYLTLNNAKELLNKGSNVFDAAYGSGLSGSSRLYDLCVKLEAASPGEIRRGGEGLEISYGFGFSPFGECLLAISQRGIIRIVFVGDRQKQELIDDLRVEWPNTEMSRDDEVTLDILQRVFNRDLEVQNGLLRAYVKATKFQLHVWRALLKIPPGQLVTYGQVAHSVGNTDASRAVGSAIGKNPLAYLIPCHRVIRGTGIIGNYRWGRTRKKMMIVREANF